MQIEPAYPISIHTMPLEVLDIVFHKSGMEPEELVPASRACKLFHTVIERLSSNAFWLKQLAARFPFKATLYRFPSRDTPIKLFKRFAMERNKLQRAKKTYFAMAQTVSLDLTHAFIRKDDPLIAQAVLQPFFTVKPIHQDVSAASTSIRVKIASLKSHPLQVSLHSDETSPSLIFCNQLSNSGEFSGDSPLILKKIEQYEKIVLPLALDVASSVFTLDDAQEMNEILYAILYPFQVLGTKSPEIHYYFYLLHSTKGSSQICHKKAMSHLKLSASQNFPPALFMMAKLESEGIRNNRRPEKAFQLYQQAADAKFTRAYSYLGQCHEFGTGTEVNPEKALELYIEADRMGCPEGSLRLGLFLQRQLMNIDPHYLYSLFCKAAEGGLAEGVFQKARCLEYGIGVNENKEEALKWYGVAKDAGHAEAKKQVLRLSSAREEPEFKFPTAKIRKMTDERHG